MFSEAEKSVNVGDFLKLFAADGSAAGNNLPVLQGKVGQFYCVGV